LIRMFRGRLGNAEAMVKMAGPGSHLRERVPLT
jgi:hypothetical protein